MFNLRKLELQLHVPKDDSVLFGTKLFQFCFSLKLFAGEDPSHSTVAKAVSKMGLDKQTNAHTHTHTLSGHQWLCSKFPFKGSPQDRLCANIIQGPFEVHTWNVFWLGCREWHLSPLGYWRGEALLGRLEVERQHLVVPAASPRHISHI